VENMTPSSSSKIDRKVLLESLDKKQEIFLNQIQDYENRKLSYIKLILGLYAVLLPVTTIIITVISNARDKNIFDNSIVMMVSGVALIIIGVLSLALLKYLIATKAGSAIVMRQINCNRQAIHALLFESFDNVETSCEEDFKLEEDGGKISKNSYYYRMVYRHTRLPLVNELLRKNNCDLCESMLISPDGFLSIILSSLILAAFGSGIFALLNLGGLISNSFISGVVSLVVMLLICFLIVFIIRSSWKRVEEALDCDQKA
jgi:hypothetical protein